MSFTRVYLALFTLLLLAGGYYYLEVIEEGRKKEERVSRSQVLDLSPDEVNKVSIKRPGEEAIELAKETNGWRITKPVKALADRRSIESVISAAASLASVADIKDENLSGFGLDNPRTYVFTTGSGKKAVLNIGSKNPVSSNYYVTGDKKSAIRMVEEVFVTPLIKNFFELRDKRLLSINADQIESVTISTSGEGDILLEKKEEGKWRIVAPVNAPARGNIVSGFLNSMADAAVSGFIDEEEKKPGEYGLSPPLAVVTFKTGGDDATSSTILFGAKTPGGAGTYAKSSMFDSVLRIPGELYDKAPFSIDRLLDLGLLAFDINEISRIAIERKNESITLESEEINGENRWKVIEPKGVKTDPLSATSAIYEIGAAKATSLVAESGDPSKYNLDDPDITVTIWGPGEKVEKLIAKKSQEKRNFWYAKIAADPAIYGVDEAGIDSVAPTLFRFADRRLFGDTNPKSVGRIVIKRLGQTFDIRREGEKIVMVSPENGLISSSVFDRLIYRLSSAKYEKRVEKSEIKGEIPDFSAPALSVMIYNSDGKIKSDVIFLETNEIKKRYLAKFTGDATLYLAGAGFIRTDIIEALETLLNPDR